MISCRTADRVGLHDPELVVAIAAPAERGSVRLQSTAVVSPHAHRLPVALADVVEHQKTRPRCGSFRARGERERGSYEQCANEGGYGDRHGQKGKDCISRGARLWDSRRDDRDGDSLVDDVLLNGAQRSPPNLEKDTKSARWVTPSNVAERARGVGSERV